MHISCCRMSKILVDGGRNVNILYEHALDRMEDTPELARKRILPQTQSLLYGFDESEARSSRTVTYFIRADLYNVVTEFCVLYVEYSNNTILGRPWIHMMGALPSTHHQLLN